MTTINNVKKSNSINPIDTHVGNRVKLRRMMLDMSQDQLAINVGVTFQQIQKYEKGVNRISSSRLYDIAKVLQTNISFFFDDIDIKNNYGNLRVLEDKNESIDNLRDEIIVSKDPMQRSETLVLVNNYWRLSPEQRKAFLDLLIATK